MADLIGTPDLEARLGRSLTSSEAARAPALMADASALIRRYTGQQFEVVADDVVTLRPVGVHLRLPQRPVTAVDQVVAAGCDPLPDLVLPVGSWCWDGIDLIELFPLSSHIFLSLPEWWHDHGNTPDTYRVTYDHGAAEIPPDVVAVAAGVVLRVLSAPSQSEGMVSERIGQYFYQMQQGMGSVGLSVRLTADDKEQLRRYRRTASTVALRVR